MSNPQLKVRIPRDHWIWRVQDPEERRKRVLEALEFYVRWHDRIEEVLAAVEEMRRAAAARPGAASGEDRKRSAQDDWRFMAGFEKLMDALP
ncbi:MAG: hypothetical protein ACPLRW_08815 [Moorellales bacterium]